MATLRLGDIAQILKQSMGTIKFHEWLGDSWGSYFRTLLILLPFVLLNWNRCKLLPEFVKRNTKVIAKCRWIRVAHGVDQRH
jgi:hypothetical protein